MIPGVPQGDFYVPRAPGVPGALGAILRPSGVLISLSHITKASSGGALAGVPIYFRRNISSGGGGGAASA